MRASALRATTVAKAAAAALVFLLAGCGGTAQDTTQSSTQPATAAASPSFTGPWASEFADAYGKAQTDFGRSILADGDISAQEMEELHSQVDACMQERGYSVHRVTGPVTYSTTGKGFDVEKEQSDEGYCEAQYDENVIGPLYSSYRGNPDNIDSVTLVLNCLKHYDLVDQSMTREEFIEQETDVNTSLQTYKKYEDSSDPEYDSTKAEEYEQCRTSPISVVGSSK